MSTLASKKKNQTQPFQNVKVVVRVRPLNKQENDQNVKSIIKVHTQKELLLKDKKYTFDRIFKPFSTQIEIYCNVVAPLIQDVVAGYNCSVFAYGQTGSGKTFTMTGDKCSISGNWKEDDEAGIIPRAAFHIFEELSKLMRVESVVKVSYIELYNEEIRDLLSEDEGTLNLYSDTKGGLFIQGIREVPVYHSEDICKLVQKGIVKRQIAPTLMNHQSSRSHTVFTISVNISETTVTGDDILKSGKINLVDLAGSENIARSGCKDLRAMELANINRSLLTLGRVIHALADKTQKHIPYRDSKLTRILQDSLGGHTKTVIIATVSPAHTSQEETASTLDYATRARDIKNAPVVNEKMTKHEMIDGLVKEIDRLQKELDAARAGTGFYVNKENYQRLIDAVKAVTGEEVTSEDLDCKRVERIANLEEIVQIKMQHFKDTVKACKKHQEELQLAQDVMKQKEESLEQEKYISKWYESLTNDKLEENEQLIKATNMLNNEKEILLAKLENQFTINSTNETVTQAAINRAISLTDSFHKESEGKLAFYKNTHMQFMEDFTVQKTDLEKYAKHFKEVENNIIQSDDQFKGIAVKEKLSHIVGEQQKIIQEKLMYVEEVLLNCDRQLKMLQVTIPDMAITCKDKIEKSSENLDSMVVNMMSKRKVDSSEILQKLTTIEDDVAASVQQGEEQLKELENFAHCLKTLMTRQKMILSSVNEVKESFIQKEDEHIENMKSMLKTFKEHALDSISEYLQESSRIPEVQEISGTEVQEITKSVQTFMDKLNDFSISVEAEFKNTSEEIQNFVTNKILRIYSDLEFSLDKTLNSYISRTGTLFDSTEEFFRSIDDFIDNLKSTLVGEILQKNVKARHIGDTPVKKSLNIPNSLRELTPREVLLEKFAQTIAKIDEKEESD